MHQYETLTLAHDEPTIISALDEIDNRIEALEQKTSKPFLFSKRYSIIDLILFAALSGIIDGIMKGLNIW